MNDFFDAFLKHFRSYSLSKSERKEMRETLSHIHSRVSYDSDDLLKSVLEAIDFAESTSRERGLSENKPIVGDRLLSKDGYTEFASPLTIVKKLVDYGADKETIIAALIYHSLRQPKGENGKSALPYTKEEPACSKKARQKFGDEVVELAISALDIRHIVVLERLAAREMMSGRSYGQNHLKTHQRMSLEVAQSPRAHFIRLAQFATQLDAINKENTHPDEFDRMINLANDVYIPLAAILGFRALRCDMENRVLQLAHPEVFKTHERLVDDVVCEATIPFAPGCDKKAVLLEHIKADIWRHLPEEFRDETKYKVTITARAKSESSIDKKVAKESEEGGNPNLDDILGGRIVIEFLTHEPVDGVDPREPEKTPVLAGAKAVESVYEIKEDRRKDYISNPKDNGYMSYHTTVKISGVWVELQFRGLEMHLVDEYGPDSSHNGYKGIGDDMNKVMQRVTVSLSDGQLVTLPLDACVADCVARSFGDDVKNVFSLSSVSVNRIMNGGVYAFQLSPTDKLKSGDKVIEYRLDPSLIDDAAHRYTIVDACHVTGTKLKLQEIHESLQNARCALRPRQVRQRLKEKNKDIWPIVRQALTLKR